MNKYIIYVLLIVLSFSCRMSKLPKNAVDIAFSSRIITQRIMTKALVESTSAIFYGDSLNPHKPIYVHSLTAYFTNKINSFELAIDSVKAIWTNDTTVTFNKVVIVEGSIIYKQVTIPSYKAYLGTDALNVNVVCEYFPYIDMVNGKKNLKCLTADYIIEEQTIITKNKFKNCNGN